MKKPTSTLWICKHCGTEEAIPDKEFGIKTEQLTAVLCLAKKCGAVGKRRKMVKQE